jgi:hypothetical protein
VKVKDGIFKNGVNCASIEACLLDDEHAQGRPHTVLQLYVMGSFSYERSRAIDCDQTQFSRSGVDPFSIQALSRHNRRVVTCGLVPNYIFSFSVASKGRSRETRSSRGPLQQRCYQSPSMRLQILDQLLIFTEACVVSQQTSTTV